MFAIPKELVVLLFIISLGVLPRAEAQETSKITVFYDEDKDGQKSLSEDQLLPGVSFVARDADDRALDVRSNGDGTYTLDLEGRTRVEAVRYPDGFQEGVAGISSIFFINPGEEVFLPAMVSYADSSLFDTTVVLDTNMIILPCYDAGAIDTKSDVASIVGFGYSVDGIAAQNGGEEQNPVMLASMQQTGAVWGVASQVSKSRIFTGALTKRHVPMGPQGAGGLYVYSLLDSALQSYDLQGVSPTSGPVLDFGSVRRVLVDGQVDGPYDISRISEESYDVDAFDKVGKSGYGDLDLDDNTQTLWMVNLNQRSLVKLDVSQDDIDLEKVEHYPIEGLPGLPQHTASIARNINCGGLIRQTFSNGVISFFGGESYTDYLGQAWERNKYQTLGSPAYRSFEVPNAMTDGYTENGLYNTWTFGQQVSYEIPVPNGTYSVTLQFAEPENYSEGDRLFDISVENRIVEDSFDIVREAGGARIAIKKTYSVSVTDGILHIDLSGLSGRRSTEALIMGIMFKGDASMITGIMRPWALAFRDGMGYLGLVSDASISKSRYDVHAYVLQFDPNNIGRGFSTMVDFTLAYRRERVSMADSRRPRPLRTSVWEAWIESWDEAHIPTVSGIQIDYAQPILSDIDFDSQGNMVIGLMDRWGHQSGYNNRVANPDFSSRSSRSAQNSTQLVSGYAGGDILKACKIGDNYVLECSNNDPGTFYMNDDGPNLNGEFFHEDYFRVPGVANHGESFTGGLGIMPGEDMVVNTVYNPLVVPGSNSNFDLNGIFSQGLRFYDTREGNKERAYLFIDQYEFGKANGLGDVEANYFRSTVISRNQAPFEIGNLIWVDSDKDGVQDANEYGVPGVQLILYCTDEGTEVARTVTDANGNYVFTNIESFKCYEIRVDLSQPAFSGLDATLTLSDAGSNDNIDSDASGDIIPGFAVIRYCTGIVNRNDHSLDIGVNGPPAADVQDAVCTFEPGASPLLGIFDFAKISSQVDVSGLNTVTYFATESDANNNVNEITAPDTFPTTTLYARVTSAVSSNIFSVSEVDLRVIDGQTDVNFSTTICSGSQLDLRAPITLSYNSIEFFANPDFTGPIANPATYMPPSFPHTVYYRVMTAGSCMIQGMLGIDSIPAPIINAGDPASICMGQELDLRLLRHSFDPNGSGATQAVWSTNGFGRFVPGSDYATALRYRSDDRDLGLTPLLLYLEVTDYQCTNQVVRDSVPVMVTDTCPRCPASLNCRAGINVPCGTRIRLEDVLSSDVREQDKVYYTLKLTNEFGVEVPNPLPVDFEGTVYATVTLSPECGGASCMSSVTVKPDNVCLFEDMLDTAVWCVDSFLLIDPRSREYDPYRPVARLRCRGDILSTQYLGDQYLAVPEDSDTAKLIARCWRAYLPNKDVECEACDTIAVIKLPELGPQNLIVPQKDTVSCELVTTVELKPTYGFQCWKQLVNLHSDDSRIWYPKDRIRELIAVSHTPSDSVFIKEIIKYPLLIRGPKSYTVYDTLAFETILIGGEEYFSFKVKRGDLVLSNGGSYIEVTEDWFYSSSEKGFWVDICMPSLIVKKIPTTCDEWIGDKCHQAGGVKILLPNRPYLADTCVAYCITEDFIESAKCCIVMDRESKFLSSHCPKIEKEHILIKQLCFAEDVALLPDDCALSPDGSGIVSAHDGIIHIERWTAYVDEVPPLYVEIEGSLVANTNEHDCDAIIKLPKIKFKDDCSGVKSVKAYASGSRMIQLQIGDDGYWFDPEVKELKIPYSDQAPTLYFEAIDSCHNVTIVDSVEITIQDRTSPSVYTDDRTTVSISSKTSWVSVNSLVEADDNCAVKLVLGRRLDWKEAYGVDLCDEEIAEIKTQKELEDYLKEYDIKKVLDDTNIEKAYLKNLEWLEEDYHWCQGLDHYILDGWREEVVSYWAEKCAERDEHGNSAFQYIGKPGIGGGWTKEIPVSCEDACEEIVVELLVVDQACNYTKAWTILSIEDKSPVHEACKFEDVYLSCSSYESLYKGVLDAAVEAGNSSVQAPEQFAQVDELLGGLLKGWRSTDNKLVDMDGSEMDKSWSYATSACVLKIDTTKQLRTLHDGTVAWEYIYDSSIVIEEVEMETQLGGVFVLCDAFCEQDIWIELDECGVGTITRRWSVNSGCRAAGHSSLVQYYEQKIHVQPACELSPLMFDVPNDTMLCRPLEFDFFTGNLILPLPSVEYTLGDEGCRQLGISYDEEILAIEGEENKHKVHRTWKVSDWCGAQELVLSQKVVIIDTCEIDASRNVGVNIKSMYNEVVSDVRLEVADMEINHTQRILASDGKIDLTLAWNKDYRLSAQKSDDWLEGIDIGDLYVMTNAVLGKINLDKYMTIAADVNRDGRVNGLDIIQIRSLLLGKSNSLSGDSWYFMDENTGETSVMIPARRFVDQIRFLGIKKGNVHDNRNVSRARSNLDLYYTRSKEGRLDTYKIFAPGEVSDLEVVSMVFPGAGSSVVDISSDYVAITKDNWHVDDAGALHLIFELNSGIPVQGDIPLVQVTLSHEERSEITLGLSSVAIVGAEARSLSLNRGSSDDNIGKSELFQSRPNPTSGLAEVPFLLDRDQLVSLTFYDISGKVLLVDEQLYTAGMNVFLFDADKYGVEAGIVYYKLDTEGDSFVKKMTIVQ